MPRAYHVLLFLVGSLGAVLVVQDLNGDEERPKIIQHRRTPKPLAERQIVFESDLPHVSASQVPLSQESPVAHASYVAPGPSMCTQCRSRCGGNCRVLPRWRGRPCFLRLDPAQPLGASLRAHMEVQVRKGQAAQLVLYRYDFQDVDDTDPSALNRFGIRRLERLLPLLEASSCPLIIEPEPGHPDVSQTRRLHVLQLLSTKMCSPVDDQRVVVAEPPPGGLSGVEAIEIDKSLIEQTRTQGGPMPSNVSGSQPSSGGSSFGSSQNR